MHYSGIMPNDFINGEDVCVSFWTQGCPHRCPGCHNPETWDYGGGYEDSVDNIITKIDGMLNANGLRRNLSILGGEPLCESNIWDVEKIIIYFKNKYPDIKIFLWTGYVYENCNMHQNRVLSLCDAFVEGRYIESKRDISLKWRGSSNQRIFINDGKAP